MRSFCLGLLLIGFYRLPAQLRPEQWQADIAILKKELPARSPELFAGGASDAFQKDLTSLSANLAGQTDLQIALQIQTVVAGLKDGQTKLDLQPLLLKEMPIPFGLGWYADGLYVSGTVSKFEKAVGKKILQINGMPVADALSLISMYSPLENINGMHYDALTWLRFPVAFRLAGLSNSDTLDLLMENKTRSRELARLFPLNFSNRNDMMPVQIQQDERDIRWQSTQSLFSLRYLAKDSVLYVQYNQCLSMEMALQEGADSATARQFPQFRPLADSIVHFLRINPRTKLFLDLRFNPGGDPADGYQLAKTLSDIPSVNRTEKLFVAVNLYTANQAVDIASHFRSLTHATLIGDPPASGINHCTVPNSFTLPNCRLTLHFGTRCTPNGKKSDNILMPDQLIGVSFADFKAGKDPVLDWVRKR